MHSRIFLPCHATQLQLRNAPRASSSIVNIVMSWQCWTYGVWFKKHPGSTQIHIRFGLVSRMFFPMIPYWKHRRQCLGKGSTAWKRHDTCRQLFEKGDLDRGKKEPNILLVVFWCVDAHTQESLLGSLGRDSPMDHETNSTSSLPRTILELQKLMPDLLQQYGYVSRNWRLIVNQGSFDPQPDQLSCDLNLFFPRFSVPVEDGVRKGRSGSGLQLDQKDYQLGMDPFTSDNHIFWGWTSNFTSYFWSLDESTFPGAGLCEQILKLMPCLEKPPRKNGAADCLAASQSPNLNLSEVRYIWESQPRNPQWSIFQILKQLFFWFPGVLRHQQPF